MFPARRVWKLLVTTMIRRNPIRRTTASTASASSVTIRTFTADAPIDCAEQFAAKMPQAIKPQSKLLMTSDRLTLT